MNRIRSYNYLLEFYLRANVYGHLGELNKQYFPKDWEEMLKELDALIGEHPHLLNHTTEGTK